MLKDTILISFAGTDIHKKYQTELHYQIGDKFKYDIKYTGDWFKKTRWFKQYDIFKYEKYFGYFMWKPLLIKHTLEMYDCENVLYCDTNVIFNDWNKFEEEYNRQMKSQGLFVIKSKWINKDWTKRDCFTKMGLDREEYWNGNQLFTSLIGMKKRFVSEMNERPVYDSFFTAYIKYCSDIHCNSEESNSWSMDIDKLKNLPGFKEHRWEQSIFSLLYQKYGYKDYVWFEDWMNKVISKYYPDELNDYKKVINQNPLKTIK
jgi:hypothetical protein